MRSCTSWTRSSRRRPPRLRRKRLRLPGKKAVEDRRLALAQRREELVGALHAAEGLEAALEEILQAGKPSDARRLPHELERRADEGLGDQRVEGAPDMLDEVDLTRALGPGGAPPLGVR